MCSFRFRGSTTDHTTIHSYDSSGQQRQNRATMNESHSEPAYKYDTLSITTLGLASYLNVFEYPRCVLCESECTSDVLTFKMLDSLITAARSTLFATSLVPSMFLPKSNWIDKVYHEILPWLGTCFKNDA
ncbi:TPA: hypothetical protein N0F65_011138 [Lagenidium giganteum]|uniref:Uncharacterized protein n=1 Tax=Lagenidium giganteum TaxID=4803 RepID=A0AAV2ZFG8_9STRA|nr:TPA: hypothetical protein N0F65_011138 [Lagenidium giganteum]